MSRPTSTGNSWRLGLTQWREVLAVVRLARDAGSYAGPREAARQLASALAGQPPVVRQAVLSVLASQGAKNEPWASRIGDVYDQIDRLRKIAITRLESRACRAERRREPLPVERARAIPITTVFERYGVSLRRQGYSFVAKCPFHDDRRPSLSVDPQENLWFCHVCQVGGDSIRLVEQLNNISFAEAVRELAA
jgi:hypothetical protein